MTVYIAGICLDIRGPSVSSFVGDFGPFLHEREFSAAYRVDFEVGVPPEPCEVVYERHDLSFYGGSERAFVRTDGQLAGFLAGIELALDVIIRKRGGMLVHAAAGTIDGQAFLMPGPSGTGKSTAARAGFDRVLSDERVVILPSDSNYRVWGTPFWSDGRQLPLDPGSAPLNSILMLSKATQPYLENMDRGSMLSWLLRSVVVYDKNASKLEALFDLATRVVSSVQCRELFFPREGKWASSVLKMNGVDS